MSLPTERTPLLREDSAQLSSGSTTPTVFEGAISRKVSTESISHRLGDEESGDNVATDVADVAFWTIAFKIMPLIVGMLLSAMEFTITIAASAPIGGDLHGLQSASWITTGYMLALASFQPLYGKLSDIFGRKQCMLFAYTVFAIGTLACGLARSMTELIAARILSGAGGGGIATLGAIIMSDLVPLRLRGTWQGVGNTIWALGMGIGAPLGGFLADTIGWRWAFLLQVPVAVLAIISVSLCLDIPKPEEAHWKARLDRIDFAGALSLVAALIVLLTGLDHGGNVAWADCFTIMFLIAAVVLVSAFAYIESRVAKEPFAPTRIIADRALLSCYICNSFATAACVCSLFYSSLYAQAVTNKSASEAGLSEFPFILGVMGGGLFAGIIMQVTGRYYILTVLNYLIMFGGTLLMALSTGMDGRSFAGLEVGMFLMSFAFHGGVTTTLVALLASASSQDTAVVVAASYLFRSLGSVLGLSIGSTIFQSRLRHLLNSQLTGHDINEVVRRVRETLSYLDELDPKSRAIVRACYSQGLQATFWYCTAATAIAAVVSFFIKEKPLTRK